LLTPFLSGEEAKVQPGGSIRAIAENVGYVIGTVGASSFVGFVVGLVSRRGLRRAILDDEVIGPVP
jgi:hypothetical protein